MKFERIQSFTGLRFVMIMVIVLAHFEFLGDKSCLGDFYYRFLHNPTFSVDFFFMISGFGMMLGNLNKISIENKKNPPILDIKYGINHVKRIYPVYIATISVVFIVSFISFLISKDQGLTSILLLFVKYFVNILLLQALTGMMSFTHAFNGVSWFLSSLFCIYLVSPIFMFLIRKKDTSILKNIFNIVLDIVLLSGISYLLGVCENRVQLFNYLVYGGPYCRIFYVLIGMHLALIYSILRNEDFYLKSANFIEIFISIVVVFYCFLRNSFLKFDYIRIIDCMLCAIFVFIFSFDKGCISKILGKNKIQMLGNISMYIFLIHYPIRMYLTQFAYKYFSINIYIACLLIFIILLGTFLISFFIYARNNKYNRIKIK